MILRRLLLAISLLGILSIPTSLSASAGTNACADTSGNGVMNDQSITGVFLKGICKECWERGDCAIRDIETVVINFGNFILYILGIMVFVMYLLGGGCLLISRGNEDWYKKGMKFIKGSTYGLIITLVAFTGIKSLESILRSGSLPQSGSNYVICDGSTITEGQACSNGLICSQGQCVNKCVAKNSPDKPTEFWICLDQNGEAIQNLQQTQTLIDTTANLCPGDKEILCTHFRTKTD